MRRPPWWLVALLVLLALAFQGTRGIWEPDEGRYTAAGVNMLETGDWIVPTIDREHAHLTKPPVTYWAIAASMALLGKNEWAARLPYALAFVGTGLLLFGLGRRFCPSRPWLPPLVWCLSLAPVAGANIVSTDALLVFFETAAMYAFVEWWSRESDEARRWSIVMWVGWGLAFMTKGPPALLPLPAAIAFLAVHDRSRLRGLFRPSGLAAFAIVAFTWFAVIVVREPDRLGYFLGYEVYDRVFTGVHRRNPQWYGGFEVYLPVMLVGSLPWWAFALAAAGGPRRAWRRLGEQLRAGDRRLQLLLYWLLVPLTVFFLARSRLHLYVLPLFVPLALLLARPLERWPWLTRRRLAWIGGTMAVLLVAFKGAVAHFPANRDARAMADAMRHVIDLHDVEELAFVNMKPFYGLTLYLDIGIESVHIEGEGHEYSKFLAGEALCDELTLDQGNLYVIKRDWSERFLVGTERCAGIEAIEVGSFEADDDELVLYIARPVSPSPTS